MLVLEIKYFYEPGYQNAGQVSQENIENEE